MGKMIQMIVVLVGISLVSGLALGGLNALTYERAENNILKFKKIPAVADIYQGIAGKLEPAAREELEEKLLADKKVLDLGADKPFVFFVIEKDGRPYAVAIENSGKGYGGNLGVMVGFDLETGDLAGVGITTNSETPGVGSRVTEESFLFQFRGMKGDSVFKVKKDGGDIDAVTGATISSRAVSQGIENARSFFRENEEKIRELINQ